MEQVKKRYVLTKEQCAKGGKTAGSKHSREHMSRIAKIGAEKRRLERTALQAVKDSTQILPIPDKKDENSSII